VHLPKPRIFNLRECTTRALPSLHSAFGAASDAMVLSSLMVAALLRRRQWRLQARSRLGMRLLGNAINRHPSTPSTSSLPLANTRPSPTHSPRSTLARTRSASQQHLSNESDPRIRTQPTSTTAPNDPFRAIPLRCPPFPRTNQRSIWPPRHTCYPETQTPGSAVSRCRNSTSCTS